MEEPFSFRALREKDKLRYSLAEIRHDRHRRVKGFSKPGPPIRVERMTRAMNVPPGFEFSETPYIQDQCDVLYAEVWQLRTELIPLRRRRAELQAAVNESHNQQVVYNSYFELGDPGEFWSAIEHKNTGDVLGARKQAELTEKEKGALNGVIKMSNIESLGEVVAGQRLVTREKRAEIAKTADEIENLKFRAQELRSSAIYSDIQRRRVLIEDMESMYEDLLQENRRLKAERSFMRARRFPKTPEEIDKVLEIKPLLKDLDRANHRRREAAKDLSRAANECQEAAIFERMNTERIMGKLRTVFVGFFDESVSEADLHKLMDRFGFFKCEIGKRDYQGSEYSCAYLEYETHEAAADAVLTANGCALNRFVLRVLWNDEVPDQPYPPQPPVTHERSTAPRARRSLARPLSVKNGSVRAGPTVRARANSAKETGGEAGVDAFFATNLEVPELLVEDGNPSKPLEAGREEAVGIQDGD
jgi:hypothetical protein